MRKLLFLLLGFLIGASACKTSSPKVRYTPETIVPTEKSVTWKISGKGLKKPSYLYGTIHLIPKEDFEMPGSIREGLDHVKRVTFEIDMKDMTNLGAQMSMITKSFMAGGKTLKDLLSPEDYKFVRGKMADRGLPVGMFERMKPMFLSTVFSTDNGPEASGGPTTSVEMELYKAARHRKLESAGLETMEYQMAVFDSIPYADQAKMLVDGLRSTDTTAVGDSELDKMLDLYKSQDIAAMQTMIGEEGGMSRYEDIILKRRNTNWIPVMGRMMAEKPTMFAVGAGHLGGKDGVIALLRKAGYTVEVAKEP